MPDKLFHLVTDDFLQLDSSVQERVYQEFYLLVYRMVMFIVRDHAAAEDIIQESFLRAVRKAGRLDAMVKLEPWLKKLTRNVTLNHFRKLKRNRAELDENSQLAVRESAEPFGSAARLEKEVEFKFVRDAIARYMAELHPSYRQILAMKLLYNMSYKEMADELGISEGAVRQRLYRARAAIRKHLERDWGYRFDRETDSADEPMQREEEQA
ncbi:RNA polymerase sigma factor [Gordoniibacillus kamchatkensis]|uniref:RNA polymerase sigma factor n=1 Tax=Gordoniibacillus kamchatkensis TaxID=1590651 RepID=UPI0009E45123|nr:sigma-70 family RNA polymerase sigma factor [Paenibacillus sp. VKM B-2647]